MFYPCFPIVMPFVFSGINNILEDPLWIAEPSMRGIRCLAHKHNNRIDLWTRDRMRITAPLEALRRQILSMTTDQMILDGVLIGDGKLKDNYYVFDIASDQGILSQRYAKLICLYWDGEYPLIQISQQTTDKYKLLSDNRTNKNTNGIILKHIDKNYYVPAKNKRINHDWIKIIL
ncbi:MAG: hypothetical protein LLG40_13910 [Deltaproteobacteria bacterium]|nr:hypothetical protein [Deltaproteobacteria bacterium]